MSTVTKQRADPPAGQPIHGHLLPDRRTIILTEPPTLAGFLAYLTGRKERSM